LHTADGNSTPLKVRSIVGMSVLFNAVIIRKEYIENLPDFKKRMDYVKQYNLNNNKFLPSEQINENGDILISLVSKEKINQLLTVMLDEEEFLSPGGIRALSKIHLQHPYSIQLENTVHSISYLPAESDNSMFGGNSNWRGPVWIPMNYLIIQTLYQLHNFYGNKIQMDYPTGSGNMFNLKEIADSLSAKIISIFTIDENGKRQVIKKDHWFYKKPENNSLILFHEYYNGDTAQGLGASHQTGWSSLVASLIANNNTT
jgi:hypothetical protein